MQVAAQEHDEIGWMNLSEGWISTKWQQCQAKYYLHHRSHCMARAWAEGLVSNLFAIIHKMWILQNEVVHARDKKGIKVKEGEELWEAIAEQFVLGTIRLLSTDRHYIAWGHNIVEAMMGGSRTEDMAPWNLHCMSSL